MATLGVALLAGAARAQTIIDDFSSVGANTVEPPGVVRTTLGTTTVTDAGLSNVIGGVRTLTLTATAIAGGSPEVHAGVMPLAQVLDYSSTVLANGLVTLRYDANGVGLNADLSSGDGIQFSVVADLSSLPYDVTVAISDGTITNSSTQTIAVGGLQNVQFFYSSFPTVDLTDVFSITVTFDPNLAGDLEVGAPIETFGEPYCGNAAIDPGESCDDGNGFGGDGCEPDCTLSTACTFTHGGTPTERFVGACGMPSLPSIQAAVNASAAGDVVSICPGTYNESVIVSQEVRIRSTAGTAVTTVQSPGVAFDVRRSGVRIEGLTIEGATAGVQADSICGLGLASCAAPGRGSNLTVTNNVIRNGALGVGWQRKVDCAAITANALSANAAHIDLNQQENPPAVLVTVQGNTLSGGGGSGQSLRLRNLGSGLSIAQNSIDGSSQAGVVLADLVPGTQFVENSVRNSATDGLVIKPGAGGVRVIQNNIEDNGVGLANEAPEAVNDATLNWWGSQTGPFHTVDRPAGLGDQILERLGGLDTTFVEFLCAPAPAGLPSIGGVCDDGGGGAEVQFLTFGRSPDVSPNGRYIAFVGEKDLNGDVRITVDNTDLSDEVFLLNRKPSGKPNSFCIGGTNPGGACTKQSQCPADLNQDPIITDGVCVLVTQLSHDPSGNNVVDTPRVTERADIFSTQTADLVGANPDLSNEVVRWSARDFRRQSPSNPNLVVDAVSSGAAPGIDSQQPSAGRNGRFVLLESEANPTGGNADGNTEIFAYDAKRLIWTQITNTTAPKQNRRPSTQTGRQLLFDSDADLVGDNPDGNREIFYAEARGTTWLFQQITNSVAPVDNRAGQVARRGRVLAFSSNGNYAGQNADGNREIFAYERGVFEQLSHSTVGENVNPHANPRGRFVAFESTANLESGGNALLNRRVFFYDRVRDALTIVSRSFFGDNFVPRFSNGRFIVWESTSNLTGNNPMNDHVIYAFDRRRDD
ncbi:MAG: right-handed parallel beta-helix repeat-containing protein [Deltaproteobacteria bacterium]|nr:right-handed parallel beta-helix repeat-containing protein [Deltaproteobacteria bacterium]